MTKGYDLNVSHCFGENVPYRDMMPFQAGDPPEGKKLEVASANLRKKQLCMIEAVVI